MDDALTILTQVAVAVAVLLVGAVIATAARDRRVLATSPIEVSTADVTSSTLRIQVRQAVLPSDNWDVTSDLRDELTKRFAAENIRLADASVDVVGRRDSRASQAGPDRDHPGDR